MDNKISLKKYLLTVALGFGLGGLIWGVVMYMGIPDMASPFHYAFIIALSILGGVALQLYSKNIKEIVKSVSSLFLGLAVGAVGTAILSYPLFFISIYLLSIPLPESANLDFIDLSLNIMIGSFWLFFFIIGIIVSFLYSLFFKLKKWPMIWRGGVGFALGSLIAPVIGNSFGFLLDCQLISYLLTFSLMSAIFGVFLAWGVWGSEN
ncbi:hypothetical protein KJ756_03030 [Patescibacteria group bacterium]|nr:hypothetical protein [Patescibacteria group bacterium]